MDPARLTDIQLDALREVTHIGCGSAATALSQLLDGMRIDVSVVASRVVPTSELPLALGEQAQEVVGVRLGLRGVVEGTLLLVFPTEHAQTLAGVLSRKTSFVNDPEVLSDSALMEVGNIVASAFLNAVGRVTGLMLLPSVPHLVSGELAGMAQDLVDGDGSADRVLVLDTWFEAAGEDRFQGHVVIAPKPDSIDALLGTLGL